MHLGRFHATIFALAGHFRSANIQTKLEECAAALDQYAQSRDPTVLQTFRDKFDSVLKAAETKDADLQQPYSQQVINELSVADFLDTKLQDTLHWIVAERAFDHAGIASDLRELAGDITKKSSRILEIDKAFTELAVEFEQVEGSEAEIGVLLPREIVGESLSALTSEFDKLGKLFRAINELTGAQDYDPKIRTISSSWWQIFLELGPEQILVWVLVIERIVGLFKSNLEIKSLQQQLLTNAIPKKITDLLEKEIDKRVASGLESLVAEVVEKHANNPDQARLNELKVQLRHGLRHLAKRINQGSQIEINVSVPDDPKELPPPAEGEEPDAALQASIDGQRAKLAILREVRERSRLASTETLKISGETQLLLKYFDGDAADPAEKLADD